MGAIHQSERPAALPADGKRGLVDRDQDRVTDLLDARLDAAQSGETFDVVVTFETSGRAASRARRAISGLRVRREFELIRGFTATVTPAQARALARMSGVRRVEEEVRVTVNLEEASEDFGSDDAGLDFAVDGSGFALGRPVGICVVDTGIDDQHEQLNNGKVVAFFDAINGATAPYDDHGHGTHVASIAAGQGVGGPQALNHQGVAPGAVLYGAKALDANGEGSDGQVIAAVEWCAAQPDVDIISMSLGTVVASDGQDAMSMAVNCAADPDWSPVCAPPAGSPKIVVVAAGNVGPGPETVGTPGAAEKAITVGAVANPSGDGRGVYLAAFSSRGPTLDGRIKPDITAPGIRISAADAGTAAGYVSSSGTSMAAPFVTGVVALMVDAEPDLRQVDPSNGQLPADRLRDLLTATAQDRGPDGPDGGTADNEYGAGIVDAYAAVAEASGLNAGDYSATRFPRYLRTEASVADGEEWLSDVFEVTGDGTPISATVTIEGVPFCTFGGPLLCDLLGTGWEWDPDLDLELIDAATGNPVVPNNNDITLSECALAGEFCGVSRQETVYYMPPGPGSYRFRVYAFAGGGTFALEVSGQQGGLTAVANVPAKVYDTDGNGFEVVTLDATGSTEGDNAIVFYGWSVDGSLFATGVSPSVPFPLGSYAIVLTVTDEIGFSDSDTVLVEVIAGPPPIPNDPPVADAGPDQTLADNDGDGSEQVTLDGGASSDPDGDPLSYEWRIGGSLAGSEATLSLPAAVGATDVTLTVTDPAGASDSDVVTVTVTANQTPIADAGPDQTMADADGDAMESFTLDAGGSSDPGGAIVSYSWTEAGVAVGNGPTITLTRGVGLHGFTLTVVDEAGASASDQVVVAIEAGPGTPFAGAGDIIIDELDPAATVAGAWSAINWTGGGRLWNGGYHLANAGGTGANSVTWTPELTQAGAYKVYARWSEHANRSTDAKYRVQHDGGEVVVSVNQQINGGQWVYLGVYAMTPDAGQGVVLRDDAPGVTVADAVRFVFDPTGAGEVIVDELDPAATVAGAWSAIDWTGGGRLWNGSYHLANAGGVGANSVTWTPELPQAGAYKVYARWSEHANRSTDAKYRVQHDGGEAVVSVNQQINGGQWVYLGLFGMTPGAGQGVVLRDDAPGVTVADAVRFVLDPTGVGEVLVDERDLAATIVGAWTPNSWTGGGRLWQGGYHWASAGGTGAKSVTWTPELPQAGGYKVYARWPEALNHPSDAKYRIQHDGGEVVVSVNQRVNGGQWVYLGIYAMTPGVGQQVVLRDDAAGVTAADAVRFVATQATPEVGGPMAVASAPATLYDGDNDGFEVATLDASGSSPGNGTIASYEWHEAGSVIATGISPSVTLAVGGHSIGLTVTDEFGLTDSDSVFVEVIAGPPPIPNDPPLADAGQDRMLADNDGDGSEQVTLDASASSDPDGDPLSYEWRIDGSLAGSEVVLSLPVAVGATDVTLTVTDPAGASDSDAVTVTVAANQTPVADAGPDQTLTDADDDGSESFTLDAGGSSDPGGAIVSYAWTEAGVTVGSGPTLTLTRAIGTYGFTVTVLDEAGASASAQVTISIRADTGVPFASAGDIIVDELSPEAVVVGAWNVNSWAGGGRLWNGGYLWANAGGTGARSVTWTPNLPQAGTYKVYGRWPEASNHPSDAKYRIQHDGGETVVSVNQRINGGQWVYLGLFAMTPGAGQHVVLRDDAAGVTAADAVKFVLDPTGTGEVIVDEQDAGATVAGSWSLQSWTGGGRLWNGGYLVANAGGAGANSVAWTPALPQAGAYKVYTRWPEHANRSTDAKYRIQHDSGEAVASVNQQHSGGQWVYLGTYAMTPGAGQGVVLRDDAPGVTAVDAVKFVLDPTGAGEVLADEQDPTTTVAGSWSLQNWTGGGRLWNGGYIVANAGGSGANSVAWTPALPQAGAYKVYTRWPEHANRSTDAKYRIQHNGGETVVSVNQRVNGGQWVYLGIFEMTPGTGQGVVLRDDAPGVTAADAVRLVPTLASPGS